MDATIFFVIFILSFFGLFFTNVITYIIEIFNYSKDNKVPYYCELIRAKSTIIFLFCIIGSFLIAWLSPILSFFMKENDYNSTIVLLIIILFVILFTSMLKPIQNYFIKRKIKINGSGMMSFPSLHSAAELSYILNNNIEKDKDLCATILNIAAKDCIKIENINDDFSIIDNKYNLESLNEDEKYVYDWLIAKDKSLFSYEEWRKIIVNNINKEEFFKSSKFNLDKIYGFLIIPLFILGFVLVAMNLGKYALIVIMILFILFAFFIIFNFVWIYVLENKKIYSKKGALLIKKWDYFKKYLLLYSNLKNADVKSIIVLDKYLAYAIVLEVNLNYKKLNIDKVANVQFLKDNSLNKKISNFIDKIY